MLQRRTMETRSMYRSVKYRVSRDKDTRTADPSSCNFRIKKNSCMESTMAKTYGSQFPAINLTIDLTQGQRQYQTTRPAYLQSFNSLMDTSEQNINRRKNKINKLEAHREGKQLALFRQSKQVTRLKDRIIIPDFESKQKEVQDSQHHLLAPFNTPFSHVKFMANNSLNELKNQKHQVRQIKAGLEQVKKKTTQCLQGIQDHFQGQINKIRSILRKNQIQQQEKKLKTKRQIDELRNCHHNNINKFQELHNKNSQLQVIIFSSTPYNLEVINQENRLSINNQQQNCVDNYQSKLLKRIQRIDLDDLESHQPQMFYV